MFILVSLWGIVAFIPGSRKIFPWKEKSVLNYLCKNSTVQAAAIMRGRGTKDFIGFLINGAKVNRAQQTIKSTEVASFLNKLSELLTSGNSKEATLLAESTCVEGTNEDFRHYFAYLRHAFENGENINVERADTQNNIYETRITAKRFFDPGSSAEDVLLFRNGRLVELNNYPLQLNQKA